VSLQATPLAQLPMATPTSHLKVLHFKGNKVVRSFNVRSPYKQVIKSVRFQQPSYLARTAWKASALKSSFVRVVTNAISLECKQLCRTSPSSSLLRTAFLLYGVLHLCKHFIQFTLSSSFSVYGSISKSAVSVHIQVEYSPFFHQMCLIHGKTNNIVLINW
jgi:hypothetical protein